MRILTRSGEVGINSSSSEGDHGPKLKFVRSGTTLSQLCVAKVK